jgi:hypothetical protein
MTAYALDRVRMGQRMLGVFKVRRNVTTGAAIEDMLMLTECSMNGEWEGQILYLPLP